MDPTAGEGLWDPMDPQGLGTPCEGQRVKTQRPWRITRPREPMQGSDDAHLVDVPWNGWF